VNHIADIIAAFAIVTGIYVGTKPGSRGPAILDSFGLAVAHIEQGASGQKISK